MAGRLNIWESLPNVLINSIKRWKPQSCPCRLRKTYLQNIGYLFIEHRLLVEIVVKQNKDESMI